MNIKDFIKEVKVTVPELLQNHKLKTAESLSKVFIKHLEDLGPTKRPIHCSDKKRLQFYIKDEGKWEKDDQHEKLNETIKKINNKQHIALNEWAKQHPNPWSDNLSKEYFSMIAHVTENGENMKNAVKRKISSITAVPKEVKEN